jgi:5,10-methenyltetrahydromethanopterin hydrogenase
MLLSEKVKQSENLRQVEALYAAYSDALERILGAPKGSIQFMAAEALKVWFSSDDPLQSESFAKETGVPNFPSS